MMHQLFIRLYSFHFFLGLEFLIITTGCITSPVVFDNFCSLLISFNSKSIDLVAISLIGCAATVIEGVSSLNKSLSSKLTTAISAGIFILDCCKASKPITPR